MSMRNFLVAAALTGLFLAVVFLAASAQNQGCPPWKDPVTVGGSGNIFAEDRGDTICR